MKVDCVMGNIWIKSIKGLKSSRQIDKKQTRQYEVKTKY